MARANIGAINVDPNTITIADYLHLREIGRRGANSGAPNSNRSFPGSRNQLFWTQEHAKPLTSVLPQGEVQDWTWSLPRSSS